MAKRLTQMVSCAGWASKLAAGELAHVLSDLPPSTDDRVLIDFRTSDDAGVYKWDDRNALVQTVDFFTPIVDDPYIYGEIAAANAVSDIYAMGGRPLTALAIAAFPKDDFEPEIVREIFRGGLEALRRADVALLGGHTVQDAEIKFGYAVTGVIAPERILANSGARLRDVLFLTKPLGTGIVGTAIKFDRSTSALTDQAIQSMRALNRAAAEVLQSLPIGVVHACTDITGFGLAGHCTEMARASTVTLTIETARLPVFDGVMGILRENRSGGLGSNREHFGSGVRVEPGAFLGVAGADDILYDPQTSGGLLVAVDHQASEEVGAAFAKAGVDARRIGIASQPTPGVHVHVV